MQVLGKSNKLYIDAKKLMNKKYRELTGCFLIEGTKLVFEAKKNHIEMCYAFIMKSKQDKLYEVISCINCQIFLIEDKDFLGLSDATTPQGIVVVCKTPLKTAEGGDALILEGIQDPANMGAILRTALGSNFKDIYCVNSVDPFSPKALRSGMSSQFSLNIFDVSIDEAFEKCKSHVVLVADMNGEDILDYSKSAGKDIKKALLLGNEGQGVSLEAKNRANKIVSVKMVNGLDSLNVAVSAGILMYILNVYKV